MSNQDTQFTDEQAEELREEYLAHKDQHEAEAQWLLSSEAFDNWLYQNYPIGNGEMLLALYEDMSVHEAYLRDIGLPLDSEIKGI